MHRSIATSVFFSAHIFDECCRVQSDTLNSITPSKRRTLLVNWIVVEAGYIANLWAKCGIYELIIKHIPK